MATTNLSHYNSNELPDAADMLIGIVVSEWNSNITHALLDGALEVLRAAGINEKNLFVDYVPGSFELPMGAQIMMDTHPLDAVIVLGSVIRGETPHFEFVCNACAEGVMRVGLDTRTPVIFGVLTDDTIAQSTARSGGEKGNKGIEAAVTALKMIAFTDRQLKSMVE
jgi:6,7-dimethyl-8-ribityllumazine synthase